MSIVPRDDRPGESARGWPAWTDHWRWVPTVPTPPRRGVLRLNLPIPFVLLVEYARDSLVDTEAALRAAAESVFGDPDFGDDEPMLAAARQVLWLLDGTATPDRNVNVNRKDEHPTTRDEEDHHGRD